MNMEFCKRGGAVNNVVKGGGEYRGEAIRNDRRLSRNIVLVAIQWPII